MYSKNLKRAAADIDEMGMRYRFELLTEWDGKMEK